MFTEKFLRDRRQQLIAEKEDVSKQLHLISEEDKGDEVPGQEHRAKFPNYGDDRLYSNDTGPNEVADFGADANAVGWLEQRLKGIDAALGRLDEETYGMCQQCGNEIEEARLEANPAATLCSDDANKVSPKPTW